MAARSKKHPKSTKVIARSGRARSGPAAKKRKASRMAKAATQRKRKSSAKRSTKPARASQPAAKKRQGATRSASKKKTAASRAAPAAPKGSAKAGRTTKTGATKRKAQESVAKRRTPQEKAATVKDRSQSKTAEPGKARKNREKEKVVLEKERREEDKARRDEEKMRLREQKEAERREAASARDAQRELKNQEQAQERARVAAEREAQREAQKQEKEAERLRQLEERGKLKEHAKLEKEQERIRLRSEREVAREAEKKAREEDRIRKQQERDQAKEDARRAKEEERLLRDKERDDYRRAKDAEKDRLRTEKEAARRALEGKVARANKRAQQAAGLNGRGTSNRLYRASAIPDQSGTTRRMEGELIQRFVGMRPPGIPKEALALGLGDESSSEPAASLGDDSLAISTATPLPVADDHLILPGPTELHCTPRPPSPTTTPLPVVAPPPEVAAHLEERARPVGLLADDASLPVATPHPIADAPVSAMTAEVVTPHPVAPPPLPTPRPAQISTPLPPEPKVDLLSTHPEESEEEEVAELETISSAPARAKSEPSDADLDLIENEEEEDLEDLADGSTSDDLGAGGDADDTPGDLPVGGGALVAQVDAVEARYRSVRERLQRTTEDFRRAYMEEFDMSWIYHDSALEGVVYTFQELKTAIDPNIQVVPDSSLQPVCEEIRRHKAAIDLVRELAEKRRGSITVDTIKKIYLTLHPEEGDVKTVKYRRDIPQHRLYFHEYAAPDKIAYKVRQVIDWLNGPEPKKLKSPLKIAARAHYDLLRVFPFPNDSGKVARLLMNLILLRSDYPPAIVHSTERQRYYEALKGQLPIILQMATEALQNGLFSIEKKLEEQETRMRSFVS